VQSEEKSKKPGMDNELPPDQQQQMQEAQQHDAMRSNHYAKLGAAFAVGRQMQMPKK
jgi:hypothetical protein